MLRNAIFLLTKQQKCGIIWVKFAAIYVFWLCGEKIVGSIGNGGRRVFPLVDCGFEVY